MSELIVGIVVAVAVFFITKYLDGKKVRRIAEQVLKLLKFIRERRNPTDKEELEILKELAEHGEFGPELVGRISDLEKKIG